MSATTHQQPKPSSLGDLAGTTAFTVGLISAWLYATGWTYAYHYFDRFGFLHTALTRMAVEFDRLIKPFQCYKLA